MLVTAYKAGSSLRVTVPKAIYHHFAKINESLGLGNVPHLSLYTQSENEPYFSNCDFGLMLYLGPTSTYIQNDDVKLFGKASYGFTLNADFALRALGIVEGTKLDCKILDNTRPKPDFYGAKIIGYSVC